MSHCQTPVFLARERRDADELAGLLNEAGVGAEVLEVTVGAHGRGWQLLVPPGDEPRARRVAAGFERSRYGPWQTRRQEDAGWGIVQPQDELATPTPVYSAQSVMQAHFLKNLLEENGIPAVVGNQVLHGGSGIDLLGAPTAAEVLVAAKDAEAARQFAVQFDDRVYEHRQSPLDDSAAEDGEEAEWTWPVCPNCGAKRTTRCPICETSGTDFPPADRGFLGELARQAAEAASSCTSCGTCAAPKPQDLAQPAEEHARPAEEQEQPAMRMCTVCDEPFVPSYPRLCQWCGHKFDDGYVVEQIVADEEIPIRAIALVVLLGLLLVGGMAYFLLIL